MESVKVVMKRQDKARKDVELQCAREEAELRLAREVDEFQARQAKRMVQLAAEREGAAAALRGAMGSATLAPLRRALDDAAALGVEAGLLSEGQALWRLESRLQAAVASANLGEIRRAVAEVEWGRTLAREPPFAVLQRLEYWSEKRGDWVDCRVTDVASGGEIQISLKKKASHWFSLAEQSSKFRAADSDVAAASHLVRLDGARALLAKADALEAALQAEDVDAITTAVARAGKNEALIPLVHKAASFVKKALKARAEAEAARKSNVAAAWHAALSKIRAALQAASKSAQLNVGEKGWDHLEKDLAVERIAALDDAFDATDLAGLSAAIDQLEAEDLDVSASVLREARQALAAIASQHHELEEAVRQGDAHAIQAAIELAVEHFLPEGLVAKARAAREMAVTMDMAIKSRDQMLMASTLAQAEQDFAGMPLVQCARDIVLTTAELQDALNAGDVDSVWAALSRVEEHYFPEALVRRARAATALGTAINSEDTALLASTLAWAERECAGTPLVDRARAVLRVTDALRGALRNGYLGALEQAMQAAKAQGLAPDLPALRRGQALLEAARSLQSAMKGGSAEEAEAALRSAKSQGLPAALLEAAQSQLGERKARAAAAALEAALLRDDVEATEAALEGAAAAGAPPELLDRARQQLVERRVCKASGALEAAMRAQDPGSLEGAISEAEAQGAPAVLVERARRALAREQVEWKEQQQLKETEERKETLLAGMQAAVSSEDILVMRAAIAQGEALGLDEQLEPLREAIEAEFSRRLSRALHTAARCRDATALEQAIAAAEAQGAPVALLERAVRELAEERARQEQQRKAEEKQVELEEKQRKQQLFLDRMRNAIDSRDISSMTAVRDEGRELGLKDELVPLQVALEEELQQRRAQALAERAKVAKLAAEFKSAQEAQEFGGAVLAAQWRAAVNEMAKPVLDL